MTVIANAFGLLSTKVLDWHVRSLVPVIAVSVAVGGVKFEVYSAVPFTILKLEMFPKIGAVPALDAPINVDPALPIVPVKELVVPASVPLINPYIVEPDRVTAMWFHWKFVTEAPDSVIPLTPKYSRFIVLDVFIAA